MIEEKDNTIEKEEVVEDSELSDITEFVFRGGLLYKGVGSRETSMHIRIIVVGIALFLCMIMYHGFNLNRGITKTVFIIEISFFLVLATTLQIIDLKVIKDNNPYPRTTRSAFNLVIIYACLYIIFNLIVAYRITVYGMTDASFYLKVSLIMLNATLLSFVVGIVLVSSLINYGYFGKKRKVMNKAWQKMPKSLKGLLGILGCLYMVFLRLLVIYIHDSNEWSVEFGAICILFAIVGFGFAYIYQRIKLAEEYGLDKDLFLRQTISADDNTSNRTYDLHLYDKHFMFVVRCADDTLYAAWTTDVDSRVALLNAGKGPKYTQSRRPLRLVYKEDFKSKADAENRAKYFMQLSDSDKERELRKINEI